MATTNKATLIRRYLKAHPNLKPKALAELISAEHPEHATRGSEVSKYKTKMSRGAETGSADPAPPPAKKAEPGEADVATLVLRLKEAADALGGPEAARKILALFAD